MRGINLRLPLVDKEFDKPSQKTDLFVEQTLSSFSIEKETSFINESEGFIRRSSAIDQELFELKNNYEYSLRLEDELKEKNATIRELQKSNNELKKLIKQLQDEKDEIMSFNVKLTKELEITIEKCEQLTLKFQKTSKGAEDKCKEASKYAYFITQKCKSMPEVNVYFDDRLDKRSLIDLVNKQKEMALLVCLQVISDIIVHNLPMQISSNKSPNTSILQENESLLHSISEHNIRMAKLNKEIAKTSIFPEILQRKDSISKSPTPSLIDS